MLNKTIQITNYQLIKTYLLILRWISIVKDSNSIFTNQWGYLRISPINLTIFKFKIYQNITVNIFTAILFFVYLPAEFD